MIDRFGRTINLLRISVTDRCNLRCHYCNPGAGAPLLPAREILRFEEIAGVVREAVALGISRLRLTGGEPLMRKDLAELVRMLAAIKGVDDIAMTTNGVLLARHAGELAAAGLHRVNVSLDTMSQSRFAEITGGGDLRAVLDGIAAARQAGLSPVKLNCVVNGALSEQDAADVAAFAAREKLEVRFIHRMDLAAGVFGVVQGGAGGDCKRCNRLRLTSDGYVKPCLFSDWRFSVRQLGAREALLLALGAKPERGTVCTTQTMRTIGG